MADLIKTESNLPTDLNLLTTEIKFYINQWGHTQTFAYLNYSTMLTLLALPEGEIEKFIAEQAANGNPVEDMHVRELKAKVAKYKAELEKKNSEVTDLFAENKKLQEEKNGLSQIVKDSNNQIKELANEKGQLERVNLDLKNQLENQKPIEKVVAPADYEPLKSQMSAKDTTIEVKQTVELDKAKKELADLQAKFKETAKRAEIFQKIDTVCLLWKDIFQSKFGSAIFTEYEKIQPNRYDEFVDSMSDFLKGNNLL